MILGFTIALIGVAALAGVVCIGAGLAGKVPGDVTVISLVVLELLLIAQVVIAIAAPFTGNPPAGSLLEFWTYLISAVLLPVGGVIWAFVDRTRWATVIMGLVALAVAVMSWRMHVIWASPTA